MFSHAVLRFALVYIVTQGTIGKQRLQKLLLSLYAVDIAKGSKITVH